jgi:hypothetical protein
LAGFTNTDSTRAKAIKWPKPVAPYDTDPAKAAENCFDRDTRIAISAAALKTYGTALAQYHLRPEHKFRNGGYTDRGETGRRHVKPLAIRHIGKESNRWEEKLCLPDDDGADIDYGSGSTAGIEDALRAGIAAAGQRKVARESGVARLTIERFLAGKPVRAEILRRIVCALGKCCC